MSDPRDEAPRRTWYRGARYKGMNPTLAILGLGGVFAILVVLMLARDSGEDKSSAQDVLTRPGSVPGTQRQ